jgi:hypothetical protein
MAPFQAEFDGDFLTYYSWPEDANGEPIMWTALPVADKLWREDDAAKGGFVQEATGWKPSPFQAVMDVGLIARAAGFAS